MSGGGFYTLKQVKISAQQYCDIWMLIQSIRDFESLKKLKNIVDSGRKNVSFNEIARMLTGYGRIIHYHSNGGFSPSNLTIVDVQEGQFKFGKLDGYCRVFIAKAEEAVNVGYFTSGLPNGKFISFTSDGNCVEEGIKTSKALKSQKVVNFLGNGL
jgi:hypothetical protein